MKKSVGSPKNNKDIFKKKRSYQLQVRILLILDFENTRTDTDSNRMFWLSPCFSVFPHVPHSRVDFYYSAVVDFR